jgi:hypothetical protein
LLGEFDILNQAFGTGYSPAICSTKHIKNVPDFLFCSKPIFVPAVIYIKAARTETQQSSKGPKRLKEPKRRKVQKAAF